jgi:hypothetical protein
MCEAKRSQFNFIIDLWNAKALKSIELEDMLKYIRKNCIDELFDGNLDLFNHSYIDFSGLIITAHTKYKSFDMAVRVAQQINKKFHNNITLTMTDDCGCDKYEFFKGK